MQVQTSDLNVIIFLILGKSRFTLKKIYHINYCSNGSPQYAPNDHCFEAFWGEISARVAELKIKTFFLIFLL